MKKIYAQGFDDILSDFCAAILSGFPNLTFDL